MPENSNCSSLVDDEVMEGQLCRGRSRRCEKVRQMAQSMNNARVETLFGGLMPRGKKEVAQLRRHQRSKNDPGGEQPL